MNFPEQQSASIGKDDWSERKGVHAYGYGSDVSELTVNDQDSTAQHIGHIQLLMQMNHMGKYLKHWVSTNKVLTTKQF